MPGVPTLGRLILRRDPCSTNRVSVPVRGPIWLVGEDPLSIGDELRRRGMTIVQHDWQTVSPALTELGGLFFVPGKDAVSDLPFEAFRWLRAMEQPLRHNRGTLRLVTTGEAQPTSHAIGGLVKTARHEWPEVSCRIVNVEEPRIDKSRPRSRRESLSPQEPLTSCAAHLVAELLCEGHVESELINGEVFASHLIPSLQSASVQQLDLKPGSLIIITGGARGVTAEAALAMARAYQPTLLLLGRSSAPRPEPAWLTNLHDEAAIKRELIARAEKRPTPKEVGQEYRRMLADREMTTNRRRFEEAGAVVDYQSVDVRDADAMKAVIDDARQKHGPIRGIIHGSGVLADKRICDKSDEQFRSVYDTKVLGLESLLAATQDDPLAFIALFSSSTGRFGRTGQCDYAAANEYLNATARRLRHERPNCRTVAINWGPWDGGMVTPGLRKVFAGEGVGLIPPSDGGQFLVAELSARDAPAEVVVLGPPPGQPTVFTLSIENVRPLGDHVLDGKCVLPIALAIEYTAESAVRRFPDYRLYGINNLRVLHPLYVPAIIQVHCESPTIGDGKLTIPVRIEANGRACYRADVVLAPLPTMDRHVALEGESTVADCYADELFHGKCWHVISAVQRCDAAGISVLAHTGPLARNWITDGSIRNWHAEPMAIDSVLQAIIVYTQRQHGLPSLPMAIGRIRIVEPINLGVLSVDVRVTSAKLPTIRASANIVNAGGRTVVTLDDCEFVCAESLRAAFANNRLPTEASR